MMNSRDPRSYEIIGAAMEVHREMGLGFLESVYQEALSLEFVERNIPYQKEVALPIKYKEHELESTYRADFICFPENKILVETKALRNLSGTEEAQIINYLKATRIKVELLINFGQASLEYKRLIF